jgi:hypothetical protein
MKAIQLHLNKLGVSISEIDHESDSTKNAQHQTGIIDQLTAIHTELEMESNRSLQNLLRVTSARRRSGHPLFPINATLKFLPVDTTGHVMEQPLCLVDEQNMPISDEIKLVRLPTPSARFQISTDMRALVIADENDVPISQPIDFQRLTPEIVKFEYVGDDRRTVQVIEVVSRRPIGEPVPLNVKAVSFDKLPTTLQPTG